MNRVNEILDLLGLEDQAKSGSPGRASNLRDDSKREIVSSSEDSHSDVLLAERKGWSLLLKGDGKERFLELTDGVRKPLRFRDEKAVALLECVGHVRLWLRDGVVHETRLGFFSIRVKQYKGNDIFVIEGRWKKDFGFGRKKAQALLEFEPELRDFVNGRV